MHFTMDTAFPDVNGTAAAPSACCPCCTAVSAVLLVCPAALSPAPLLLLLLVPLVITLRNPGELHHSGPPRLLNMTPETEILHFGAQGLWRRRGSTRRPWQKFEKAGNTQEKAKKNGILDPCPGPLPVDRLSGAPFIFTASWSRPQTVLLRGASRDSFGVLPVASPRSFLQPSLGHCSDLCSFLCSGRFAKCVREQALKHLCGRGLFNTQGTTQKKCSVSLHVIPANRRFVLFTSFVHRGSSCVRCRSVTSSDVSSVKWRPTSNPNTNRKHVSEWESLRR